MSCMLSQLIGNPVRIRSSRHYRNRAEDGRLPLERSEKVPVRVREHFLLSRETCRVRVSIFGEKSALECTVLLVLCVVFALFHFG